MIRMGTKPDPYYFKRPNIFVMLLISSGIILTAMCVYVPLEIPFKMLGRIGDLAQYLVIHRPRLIKAIWYSVVIIQVSEAIYAYYLAGQKGIMGIVRFLWFIYTLAFGIGSLYNLLKYNPDHDLCDEFDNGKEHKVRSLSLLVNAIEVNDEDVKKPLIQLS